MRVLHLVKTSVGATWALRQMRELVAHGVEVHVARPPGGPLSDAYDEAGVVSQAGRFDLPALRPWRWPTLFRRLRRLVAEVEPDLIHSHFVGTTLTARLALGKRHPTPRIFQVPGPLHLEHGLFRRAEIASAGGRDCWIATCELTRSLYLQAGIGSGRVFLSYYGLDLERFGPRHAPVLRQEIGAAPDRPLVGMVAYMYAPKWYLAQKRGIKGHEDLIDALAICQRQRPEILGVFIGGAWNDATGYEKRIRAYARSRCGDRIVFLGTRTDVLDLYPDLDLVVHPSHSENVGAAAESLLSGVPTIATDVGGFPDVIEDGRTGWLVPRRDPAALARAIIARLGDRDGARAAAAEGRAKARRLFDVRRTAEQVRDCYERILGAA